MRGNLSHPADGVCDVCFLWKPGLNEEEENAVADVFVIKARIGFVGMSVPVQPEGRFQIVLGNFEIDLAGAGKILVIDLLF